ncbi:MAG: helix-turn-helix domain-containing protein [Pseudonocardia sp.]
MVGSALIRRHIGRRFVALRNRAGITQDQAAIALQRARATLGRMEEGDERVRFRDIDVRAMLELYGADPEETQLLMALTAETRNGPKKSWWHDYTETTLPEWFGLYVTLENSTETIRQYQSELVPGLLQTVGYMTQIHNTPPGYIDEEESKRRTEIRLERQSLLTRPRAPHLKAILNESVLHRPVGGPKVMAAQLEHLLTATQQANVSVRVLPWSAGVHGGMGASSFSLLDFPKVPHSDEPLEPPLAYVETLTGAMYLNKADEFGAYHLVWDDLTKRALSEPESTNMITTALKGFTGA